jgi:hypothetical protein
MTDINKPKGKLQLSDADLEDLAKDNQNFQNRKMGRDEGKTRQERGESLIAPLAYIQRGGDYVSDKLTDADAYISDKIGLKQRANSARNYREGLKDEGYKKGGKVSSASKRADGCAVKGHTRGKIC